jgi:hypothetical protein
VKQVLLLVSLFSLTIMKYVIKSHSWIHIICQVPAKNTKLLNNVHCYLQIKLFGKQQKVDPVTLNRQTALTVWFLHMNCNIEWPRLPHAESVWGALTYRFKGFRNVPSCGKSGWDMKKSISNRLLLILLLHGVIPPFFLLSHQAVII